MPRRATAADLLLVSKAQKGQIDNWRLGVRLERTTGYSIDDLRSKACSDRLNLARHFQNAAIQFATSANPQYRVAVGRCYYAMYHALRALVFFSTGGDDNDSHIKLPGQLPMDFENRAVWENDLKSARLERMRADYDPYPKNDGTFKVVAFDLIDKSLYFLPLTRQYLRSKGCTL